MSDEDMMRECLSALADGELTGAQCHEALAYAQTEQGQASWQAYHVIGDVMRGVPAMPMLDSAMLERLRSTLAKEAVPVRLPAAVRELPQVGRPRTEAANASVLHWKLAAGFASLTAAVALGWTAYAGMGSQAVGGAPQLALASSSSPSAGHITVVDNVIRDPRLDDLVRQMGRRGGISQMASESFLHNASLEAPPKR